MTKFIFEGPASLIVSFFEGPPLLLLYFTLVVHGLPNAAGSAFWTHYSRSDEINMPTLYLEKVCERLDKAVKTAGKTGNKNGKREEGKDALNLRAITTIKITLEECAAGKVPDKAELVAPSSGNPAKTIEVGDFKGKTARVNLDCFLDRAFE